MGGEIGREEKKKEKKRKGRGEVRREGERGKDVGREEGREGQILKNCHISEAKIFKFQMYIPWHLVGKHVLQI